MVSDFENFPLDWGSSTLEVALVEIPMLSLLTLYGRDGVSSNTTASLFFLSLSPLYTCEGSVFRIPRSVSEIFESSSEACG